MFLPNALAAAAVAIAAFQPAASPFRWNDAGHPVIEVNIDGRGPFDFVVDTAAQQNVMMPGLIADLGLMPVGEAQVQGASGRAPIDIYGLKTLSAEAFQKTDVVAVSLPNPKATQASGILGMAPFLQERIVFDNRAMTFSVLPSGSGADGMAPLPASIRHGSFAVVEVQVNGAPMKAVIDSGAARTILNDAALAALDGLTLAARNPVRGATQDETQARSAEVDSFSMGPATFRDVTLTFSNLPVFTALGLAEEPAMILGSDLLKRLPAYAIDYPRQSFEIIWNEPDA